MIQSIIISKISGVSLYQKNYMGSRNNTRLLALLLTAIIEFGQQTTGMVVEFIEFNKINVAICIHEQSKIFCALYISSNYSKKLAKLICQEILTSFLYEFNGNLNDNIKNIGNNNNNSSNSINPNNLSQIQTQIEVPDKNISTAQPNYSNQSNLTGAHPSSNNLRKVDSSNQTNSLNEANLASHDQATSSISGLNKGSLTSSSSSFNSHLSNQDDVDLVDDLHSYGPNNENDLSTAHDNSSSTTQNINFSSNMADSVKPTASINSSGLHSTNYGQNVHTNSTYYTERKPPPNVHFKDFKHFSLKVPIIIHYSLRSILNSLELIPGVKLAIAVQGREIFTSNKYIEFLNNNNFPTFNSDDEETDKDLKKINKLEKKINKNDKINKTEETYVYNTYLEYDDEEELDFDDDDDDDNDEDEDEDSDDEYDYLKNLNQTLLTPESVIISNLPILLELSHDLLDIKKITSKKKKYYFNVSSASTYVESSTSSSTSVNSSENQSSPKSNEFIDKYLYEVSRDDLYAKSDSENDENGEEHEKNKYKGQRFNQNQPRNEEEEYNKLSQSNSKYVIKDIPQSILLQGFNQLESDQENLQMWKVNNDYYLLLFYDSVLTMNSNLFLHSVEDSLEMMEQLSFLLHELRNYS